MELLIKNKKINVNYAKRKYYCNIISMDGKFDAQYKILENVYGNYENDTIKFSAYDHYGTPAFSEYNYTKFDFTYESDNRKDFSFVARADVGEFFNGYKYSKFFSHTIYLWYTFTYVDYLYRF